MASLDNMKTHISVNTLYRYIDKGLFLKLTNKKLPVKGQKKNIKQSQSTEKNECW